MVLKHFGSYLDRDIYLMTLEGLTSPLERPDDKPYFRLLIILDNEQIPSNSIGFILAHHALEAGARTIICAGTACERVHDLFDDMIAEQEADYWPEPDDVIVTTWHKDEALDEVLWQAFTIGFSCDRFEACQPPVVVCILSGDHRISEIETMMNSLDKTFDKLLEKE